MHICPQEIMAVVGMLDVLRPTLILAKIWCEACVSGIHKTCDDHRKAVKEMGNFDAELSTEI